MRYIPARVSKDAALAFFQRRRFGNLYGLVRQRTAIAPGGQRLPYLERVWLPYYMITIRLDSRRGEGEVTVSVEAYSGAFAIFQMHDDLVEGTPEEETFPPKLSTPEATNIGRKELVKTILRRRGQQEKPFVEETVGVDLFYYPYWIYYFERRRGFLNIRLQDALTRERGGNRTKTGLLDAFAAKAGHALEVGK